MATVTAMVINMKARIQSIAMTGLGAAAIVLVMQQCQPSLNNAQGVPTFVVHTVLWRVSR